MVIVVGPMGSAVGTNVSFEYYIQNIGYTYTLNTHQYLGWIYAAYQTQTVMQGNPHVRIEWDGSRILYIESNDIEANSHNKYHIITYHAVFRPNLKNRRPETGTAQSDAATGTWIYQFPTGSAPISSSCPRQSFHPASDDNRAACPSSRSSTKEAEKSPPLLSRLRSTRTTCDRCRAAYTRASRSRQIPPLQPYATFPQGDRWSNRCRGASQRCRWCWAFRLGQTPPAEWRIAREYIARNWARIGDTLWPTAEWHYRA